MKNHVTKQLMWRQRWAERGIVFVDSKEEAKKLIKKAQREIEDVASKIKKFHRKVKDLRDFD